MLRLAIVGCGKASRRHHQLLTTGKIRGAELVAVCDVDEIKARELGDKHGIPAFTDMHEMMRSQSIDVVMILTPTGLHAEHVKELAPYGKHIIVEKPIALRLQDADEIIDASKKNHIRLFVVKQNRFNHPIICLHKAIKRGDLGKITLASAKVLWSRTQEYYDQASWRGTWRYDGGVIANQASHHIDVLAWLVGDIDTVSAQGATIGSDIEVEDMASVIYKFKNGAMGTLEATTSVRPHDIGSSITIIGSKGYAIIGGKAMDKVVDWTLEDDTDIPIDPHKEFLEHVTDEISLGNPNTDDGDEDRKTLSVIQAIYASMENGVEIKVGERISHSRLGGGDHP